MKERSESGGLCALGLALVFGLVSCTGSTERRIGETCDGDGECASGRCDELVCKSGSPTPAGGDCIHNLDCASESCALVGGVGSCAARGTRQPGQPCTAHFQCAAGGCFAGMCAELPMEVGGEDRDSGIDARGMGPDSASPDSASPDSANPDSANPDGANPDSANPDSANPDSANPDSANPDSAGPDSAGPEVDLGAPPPFPGGLYARCSGSCSCKSWETCFLYCDGPCHVTAGRFATLNVVCGSTECGTDCSANGASCFVNCWTGACPLGPTTCCKHDGCNNAACNP